jgi:hypothetical protein
MKARQVIDGASFGPDAIGAAFDATWAEIAKKFAAVERGRGGIAVGSASLFGCEFRFSEDS